MCVCVCVCVMFSLSFGPTLTGSLYGAIQVFSSPLMVCAPPASWTNTHTHTHTHTHTLTRPPHSSISSQGRLSDTFGRKPLLLLSYLIPALGYLGMGYSQTIFFLILSRIPVGETGRGTRSVWYHGEMSVMCVHLWASATLVIIRLTVVNTCACTRNGS